MKTLIEIHDRELAEDELLAAAVKTALRHQHVIYAEIFVQERVPLDAPDWKHPGWIEYITRIDYEPGGSMTLGILQRKPGAEIECHS